MVCCKVVVPTSVSLAFDSDYCIVSGCDCGMIIAELGIRTDPRIQGETARGKPYLCSIGKPVKFEPWSKWRSMCRNHVALLTGEW